MSKQSLTKLEVMVPPLPEAALMARPVQGPEAGGQRSEIADLRELVVRLAGRVEQLERMMMRHQTVCCVCGKADCNEAPHVPQEFWNRYGPNMSFDRYRNADPEGARRSEREYYDLRGRGRERSVMEDRMLGYDPAYNPNRGYWR